MSKKIEKQIKEVEAEAIDVEATGVADAVLSNLTDEQKAKLAEMVSSDQPTVQAEESKGKKILNWTKKNKWKIAGGIAAGLGVLFLGKKVYDAGMPGEFDVDSEPVDADFEIVDEVSEYETPEVVEEAEEIVE